MTRSIALDSNVWRYLVDSGRVEEIYRASRKAGVRVVAVPAVLYEAIRMEKSPTRDAVVRVLCRRAWQRLMPEAYLEAREVRCAIAKHHPEWLVPNPELRAWYALRADWAEGTWRRARTDPSRFAAILGPDDSARLEVARAEATRVKDFARQNGITLERFRPERLLATPDILEPGMDAAPFEAWRGEALNVWADVLLGQTTSAYSDWLRPWIHPRVPARFREGWIGFWSREVAASEVPRQWMRTMIFWAAATRKQSSGTPVDWQIATYMFDFEEFVTADRVFVDILEKLAPHAPAKYATPRLVSGGEAAVDELLSVIG